MSLSPETTEIIRTLVDVPRNKEVNSFQPHTRNQLQELANIIDTLNREIHHKMR